jgi:hypothetical protein
MSQDEKVRTTRVESRSVPCPVCGAPAGEPCRRENDPPSHSERHEVAVAHGATRVDRGAREQHIRAPDSHLDAPAAA